MFVMAQKSCVLRSPLLSELHLVLNSLMASVENGEILMETTEPAGIQRSRMCQVLELVFSESVL